MELDKEDVELDSKPDYSWLKYYRNDHRGSLGS